MIVTESSQSRALNLTSSMSDKLAEIGSIVNGSICWNGGGSLKMPATSGMIGGGWT